MKRITPVIRCVEQTVELCIVRYVGTDRSTASVYVIIKISFGFTSEAFYLTSLVFEEQ